MLVYPAMGMAHRSPVSGFKNQNVFFTCLETMEVFVQSHSKTFDGSEHIFLFEAGLVLDLKKKKKLWLIPKNCVIAMKLQQNVNSSDSEVSKISLQRFSTVLETDLCPFSFPYPYPQRICLLVVPTSSVK